MPKIDHKVNRGTILVEMHSNDEKNKLIKQLVEQGEMSSNLLEKFKELQSEPLWHQILILLGETDQLKNLLSSKNEKEVNILAGELEHNVLMKSKKDFIVNPGRRLIKAIELETISSISTKTKATKKIFNGIAFQAACES